MKASISAGKMAGILAGKMVRLGTNITPTPPPDLIGGIWNDTLSWNDTSIWKD